MKKIKLVTRESLTEMIGAATIEKKIKIVGRALVVILAHQTREERSSHKTSEHNSVGFTAMDAVSGTRAANAYIHGYFSSRHLDEWIRPLNGAPRIAKYHRQLNVAALEKRIDHLSKCGGNEDELAKLRNSLPKDHHLYSPLE